MRVYSERGRIIAAGVAGLICAAFALAWLGRTRSTLPEDMSATGTLDAVRIAHDTVPCSGTSWYRHDDTATAAVFARLARQMKRVADSASDLVNHFNNNEDANGTPEFFTSAAEVARRAADFGPDYLPSLLIASQAADRASTRGEGRVDTVWAKRAECYAERAVSIARRQGDQASGAQANRLLEGIRLDLEQERHAAEVERRRRP